MHRSKINLHSTESFRETYIRDEQHLQDLLKSGYGTFFAVKVEDLIRLIRLPVPPTRSTTHTLIYLSSGEANMTIGSRSYTIHQNECLIVPAGQVYAFATHDVNRGYLCNFHNDMIIGKFGKSELLKSFEFLQVWGNPLIRPGKEAAGYIHTLLRRIYRQYKASGMESPDIIQSYFVALLCELNSAYKPLSESRHSTSVTLTNRFREMVFKHIRTRHLVAEYAALLHVSPNHLNKVVKQITGRSPIKWIDEAIVLEAKVLLHQTELPVSAVSAELGITDQSYFSRLFRRHEGLTPLQFRKRIEKS